jgi:hypothetical protein
MGAAPRIDACKSTARYHCSEYRHAHNVADRAVSPPAPGSDEDEQLCGCAEIEIIGASRQRQGHFFDVLRE